MKRKKQVLFFAEAVTLAHVARPFVLAKSLDPALYDIHFACDPRFNHLLNDTAFSFRTIHSISTEAFLHALAKGSPVYDASTLQGYIDEDLRIIKDLDPDLIVGDFRLSLAVSAQISTPPCMLISNAYWSPYAKQKFPIPEHFLTKIFGVHIAQGLFRMARLPVFAHHSIPLNLNRWRYGVFSLGFDLRRVYTYADQTLYADIPELVPTYNLPDNHHYIGPVPWSPAVELPPWWDDLPREKPVVYVTMGSSGQFEALGTILSALAELPVSVVVATAGSAKMEKVPSNAWVAEFLPGEKAAGRAKLVICNGGSPTTYQALAAGTPVLGIPSNLDQYLNIQYVQKFGAGKIVRSDQVTVTNIKKSVAEMLSKDNYLEKARQLKKIISHYHAPSLFRAIVQDMLGRKVRMRI